MPDGKTLLAAVGLITNPKKKNYIQNHVITMLCVDMYMKIDFSKTTKSAGKLMYTYYANTKLSDSIQISIFGVKQGMRLY